VNIRFWGVRGSLPSPGAATVRYGGNTPCVSVEIGSLMLVFDAGTGIRMAGQAMASWSGDMCVFISHLHWDHVQGLPFFAPLHQAGRELSLIVPRGRGRSLSRIAGMDGIHFPVTQERIESKLTIASADPTEILERHGVVVRRVPMNHPGGSLGFRVEHAGKVFVFIPDNEIDPPYARHIEPQALLDYCRGAHLLLHDAQYLAGDFPMKRGWGHSEITQTADLAHAAKVRSLALYHHDPTRSDDDLDVIAEATRRHLRTRGAELASSVAAEGTTIAL
jgi:phosphoribosyl 1,2-cyclic phosphodiesterase